MNPRNSQQVFKITTRAAWGEARASGALAASADDRRDGFIHLSASHQLAGTLAKHFKAQRDLVLIEIDAAALGEDLRWERSRGQELFPHLYASLPLSAVRAAILLELDANGTHVLPQAIRNAEQNF
jgi:uncharacterized protein (DUF952 family)